MFRGSAPAKDLVEASWIDFHDPHQNPYGYQRDFDEKRSEKARQYAEGTKNPFWPESILAVRNDEGIKDTEKVCWSFTPDQAGSRFGTLSVTYTEDSTSRINGRSVRWRRAFSQVDCQHRLGKMGSSSKFVTFCVFAGVSRREEALVFRAINQNQRGIPTSLVDTIILRTDDNAPVHISWAWDLGINDPDSPFYKLVYTGGHGQTDTLIKFRGLQQSLKLMIPAKYINAKTIDYDSGYLFAKNFWSVVRNEWPNEFNNKNDYKMMVNPGVRALSRLGRLVLESKLDVQDFDKPPIENYLQKGKPYVNWSATTGPLKDATGKGAEKRVFEQLNQWFGKP